jgi:hypothetical protein
LYHILQIQDVNSLASRQKDSSLPKLVQYDISDGEETSESEEELGIGSVEVTDYRSSSVSRSPREQEGAQRKIEADYWLPPEPSSKCPGRLQARVSEMYERKIRDGIDYNAKIQELKSFRNPSIYDKLLEYCDVDELGTNYPEDLYPSHSWWGKESYYEALAKAQKEEMDKREKERKEKLAKGQKETGPAQKSPTAEEKRKSKWDQVWSSMGLAQSAGAPKTTLASFGALEKSKP